MIHRVEFTEGSSCTLLARITALDGSGLATGVPGEGNWVKQADLAAIGCKVFDRSGPTPDVAFLEPAVALSAILDVPSTDNAVWTADSTGFNFQHTVPPTGFPDGGHVYRVEYRFAFQGGAVAFAVFEGTAANVHSE